MAWSIVPQVEKAGRTSSVVKCKRLRFFPITDKREHTTFGRFQFLLLRVVLRNGEVEHTITYSNKGDRKFIYHWPPKWVYPQYVAANGRTYPDTLSPKIKVVGDAQEFTSMDSLINFLVKQVGQEVANEVRDVFAIRIE